jgi:glycosyltransferase involved in cell wall biosynthesis
VRLHFSVVKRCGPWVRWLDLTSENCVKPRIVISGVNLIEAGPLSVFKDALRVAAKDFSDEYEIIALVHDKNLFDIEGLTYLEFPYVKSSWLRRLRFEYWDCRSLSRQLNPYLWLAIHDMTPNVMATRQAVYCHNPGPFYRPSLRGAFLGWKPTLFSLFYSYLYSINLRENGHVIVQQDWIRDEFFRRYGVRNVIVAHPVTDMVGLVSPFRAGRIPSSEKVFFYPAYPRFFKNVEVIMDAAKALEQAGTTGFQVWLTINGTEDRYARMLFARYGSLSSVRWLGLLPREEVVQRYGEADYLLFASKLETWGMPISEFKQTGKPMLVADLPYAHETVGYYPSVRFFDPTDPAALAQRMAEFLHSEFHFDGTTQPSIAPPFARNWSELFHILLSDPGARSK